MEHQPLSPTPWTYRQEEHLGAMAYSIFDANGDRLAVGFLRLDAAACCSAVNALAKSPRS